jgi:hypothetical protein
MFVVFMARTVSQRGRTQEALKNVFYGAFWQVASDEPGGKLFVAVRTARI